MPTIGDVIKELYNVDDKGIKKLNNRINQLSPLEKLKLSIETWAMLIRTGGGQHKYMIGDMIYNKLIEHGMKPDDEFLKRCYVSKPLETEPLIVTDITTKQLAKECNVDVNDLETDEATGANLLDLMKAINESKAK